MLYYSPFDISSERRADMPLPGCRPGQHQETRRLRDWAGSCSSPDGGIESNRRLSLLICESHLLAAHLASCGGEVFFIWWMQRDLPRHVRISSIVHNSVRRYDPSSSRYPQTRAQTPLQARMREGRSRIELLVGFPLSMSIPDGVIMTSGRPGSCFVCFKS